MRVAVFTSVTSGYLPNARILGRSVALHQPNWQFFLLFNDRTPPQVRWEDEPFGKVVFADWLRLNRPWFNFAYGYSVVEFCTATKGSMAQYLLRDEGFEAVIYLDPDISVFSSLDELTKILESGSADVVMTPHLTDPEVHDEGIWSHEIAALKHGVYNLGFFAIRNTKNGLTFLDWWERRLLDYSHIDFNLGTFTDQKWVNLAPYMFEGFHILSDRAYNVATWNMNNREIGKGKYGEWTVNNRPLRFYHFSGFGNDFAWADRELSMFAKPEDRVTELWQNYKREYELSQGPSVPSDWVWGRDFSGRVITSDMRRAVKSKSAIVNSYRG